MQLHMTEKVTCQNMRHLIEFSQDIHEHDTKHQVGQGYMSRLHSPSAGLVTWT